MIVAAESCSKAASKVLGTPLTCRNCRHGFPLKHEYIIGAYPYTEVPPAKPVREAPTEIVEAKIFPDQTATVILKKGKLQEGIMFPQVEVQTFSKLMKTAKTASQDTVENAIIAFIIAHGSGTKSLVTGFLKAYRIKTDPTTVGEALTRLARQKILYTRIVAPPPRRVFLETYPELPRRKIPPPPPKPERTLGIFMGETVYYMSEETRTRILERLKITPTIQWWRPEMLKPTPPTPEALRKPVEYERVKITKPTPSFRAAEDFKRYGPYKAGDTAKLPITFAYFLVREGYA